MNARLFLWVCAGCLLFHTGRVHSSDAEFTIALTASLVTRGEFVTSPLWWHQDAIDSVAPAGESYAKAGIGASLSAIPFYLLAFYWHAIGMVQAVTLTNVFITALNAVVLSRLITRLGYRVQTAASVAVVWAFGTSALVYANDYFTEPISALLLTTTLYGVSAYRSERRSRYVWLIGFAVSVAIATKLVNALFVTPCLVYLTLIVWRAQPAAPFTQRLWQSLRAGLPSLLPIALTLVGIGYYNAVRYGSPLNSGYPAYETFDHPLLAGLWGLLLSSHKGVVWYNPLLFVSLWAGVRFWQRHRAEAVIIVATTLLHLALYATYFLWDGGLNWGPRYLVPLLPLWLLPLALWLDETRKPFAHIGFIGLCSVSVAVQIVGATVSFVRYEQMRAQLDAWAQAAPIWGHLQLFWQPTHWDLAWVRAGADSISVDWLSVSLLLGLLALTALAFGIAYKNPAPLHGQTAGLAVGVLCVALILLVRTSDDPRYGGGADYAALLQHLAGVAQRDEVMLLDNHVRTSFFLNQNRALPRWYALDRHADASERTQQLLERTLARYQTLWLVTDLSPTTSAQRPIEAWLTQRAYKVEDTAFSPYARLVRYDTLAEAAHPLKGTLPRQSVSVRLGDAIALEEFAWSAPTPTQPFAHLLLRWRAQQTIEHDYTVFLQLLNTQHQVVWQVDRQPIDGFRPTSAWQVGAWIDDRYGWRLPDHLPTGDYRLIVGMYHWQTGARLPIATKTEKISGDYFQITTLTVR